MHVMDKYWDFITSLKPIEIYLDRRARNIKPNSQKSTCTKMQVMMVHWTDLFAILELTPSSLHYSHVGEIRHYTGFVVWNGQIKD